jgi:hypothetical protein
MAADYPGVVRQIRCLAHKNEDLGKDFSWQTIDRDFFVMIRIHRGDVERNMRIQIH